MATDGSSLEELVAFIEREVGGAGLTVETRQKVFEGGVQIAEFDVQVKGRIGTTPICWLIECRDRPSEGSAPGAWIEQLATRRRVYGFDRVTAVSTTGFAPSAIRTAGIERVELREVRALTAEEFGPWWPSFLGLISISRVSRLEHASIGIRNGTPVPVQDALRAREAELSDPQAKVLRGLGTGLLFTLADAFLDAVTKADLFVAAPMNGGPVTVALRTNYTGEDHYVVDTLAGEAHVSTIDFRGEVERIESTVPLSSASQYRTLGEGGVAGQSISEEAKFRVAAADAIVPVAWEVGIRRISDPGREDGSGQMVVTVVKSDEA